MAMNVVFDTNIILYFLNGDSKVEKFFAPEFFRENQVYISSITRIELLSFPNLNLLEKEILEKLIHEFEIVPLIKEIEDRCMKSEDRIKSRFQILLY